MAAETRSLLTRKTLFPHQETGADFLAARPVANLYDDPGVGKTFQSVAAADRAGAQRVLVIAPAVVRNHWARAFQQQQQIERPINIIETAKDVPVQSGPIVTIVSHAALVNTKRIYQLYNAESFDAIITDEAAEFRRFEAQRTRTLLGDEGLWTRAKHTWYLTGTPIVNSAADLYPLAYGPMRLLYGEAPSWFEFCSRFAELRPDGFDGYKAVGIREAEMLAGMFRPVSLRRTLQSAGIELPDLTIENVPIDIPPNALAEVMALLEGWTPARLTQVLQDQDEIKDAAMSRVRRALGIAKAEPAVRYILTTEMPAVVFFQHTDVRNILGQLLTDVGLRVSYIDGTIRPSQLTAAESQFQDGALDVLLIQTQAGGMGLTLTRSANVIVVEQPWTATALYQAIKRVHRITQTRPVQASVLQAHGCWLDEIMASVVQRKHVAAQQFLDLLTT